MKILKTTIFAGFGFDTIYPLASLKKWKIL